MMRSLLLALALARAAALLDSPGLRGTISEAAEPAGQYSVRSKNSTRPTEACTDPSLEVNKTMIRTKGWCPTPKELKDMMLTDCPPMPGCEPEDYYTSCYDKCRAVGYEDTYCRDANVGCKDTKKNCFSACLSEE